MVPASWVWLRDGDDGRPCAWRRARADLYPAAFELLEHYPLARVFEVDCHCQRYYTETPGNDYKYHEDAVLERLRADVLPGTGFPS